MKRLTLTMLSVALAVAGVSTAIAQPRGGYPEPQARQDMARVVDVDPLPGRGGGRTERMYQECWNERYDRYDTGYYRDESGRLYREKSDGTGGALIGAIIGGVLGNQVGDGRGRTAATVAGAVAGGAIGKRIDENDGYAYRDSRGVEVRCRDVVVAGHRNRGRGAYRVTYVYAGQTYETIMRHRPGRSIPVLVDVRPQGDYVADYRQYRD